MWHVTTDALVSFVFQVVVDDIIFRAVLHNRNASQLDRSELMLKVDVLEPQHDWQCVSPG